MRSCRRIALPAARCCCAWRDRWRESLLARQLEQVTSRTVTDARALRQELDVVRSQGFAVEDGELQPRVRAVAAPVCVAGDVVAALAVSGAAVRPRRRDPARHPARRRAERRPKRWMTPPASSPPRSIG